MQKLRHFLSPFDSPSIHYSHLDGTYVHELSLAPMGQNINVFSGCASDGYPGGYTPAASGAHKAYKMLSQKMEFNQAKQACQYEGSVLAMPRTVEDISDIKEFDCEYPEIKLLVWL